MFVNIFYYPVVISKFNNKEKTIIDSKYCKDLSKLLKNNKDKKDILKEYFDDKKININIQEMYRMKKDCIVDVNIENVVNFNENNKVAYFNAFEHTKDINYKQLKWEKMVKYKYIYGIIDDEKFVSIGFVSNIDENGANIVIETKEKYRRKGYGKAIVEKISRDLIRDNIAPIYWVNKENVASINLAKSLGFVKIADEIVVKEV